MLNVQTCKSKSKNLNRRETEVKHLKNRGSQEHGSELRR